MNDIYQIIEKAISERGITDPYKKESLATHIGVALHNAGYRKQSDTIKEFAEKALALCYKHHYSIATRNNQRGTGMFTEGFEQVLSETAADLAAQFGKEE
jgi:hypothetical protein